MRAGAERFHDGKSIGSVGRVRLSRTPRAGQSGARGNNVGDQRLEIPDGLCRREARFVHGDLKRLLEREHQLDALERAQSELIDRRRCGDRASRGEATDDCGARCGSHLAAARGASPDEASHSFNSRRLSLRVPSVRGSSPDRPYRRGADLLVVQQRRVRGSDNRIDVDAGFGDEDRLHALGRGACERRSDDRGFAHARDAVQHALDVLRKDVQPLGSDDHLLLASADPKVSRWRRARRCRRYGTSRPGRRCASPPGR